MRHPNEEAIAIQRFHDDIGEQLACHGRCEVGTDRHGSSRFAHQGDALWITAEAVDILLYPAKSFKLIAQAEIHQLFT